MRMAGYINGKFVAGQGAELVVENPSDGSEVARFPGLSVEQINTAIAAARRAFDHGDWSRQPVHDRAELLHRFVDKMEERADAILEILVAETGCPRHSGSIQAQFATPMRMAREIVDLMASLPETEENPLPPAEAQNRFGQKVRSLRNYSPLGVVVGISAYNFPLHTGVWKAIPALIAGNSTILRPNPLAPLSSMAFAEAAQAVGLPPGVLNVVLEAGVEGAQLLTTHPSVDMVTFTGSSPVGAQVATQAGGTFKRVHLELGGKSAQIFLPDVAEKAVAAAVSVCTAHAGQGCVLGTRIFVPVERKAEIVEKAASAVSALRQGYANDPNTQVGPVISAKQVARCEHFVKLAVEHGGRVAAGGKRPAHLDRGFFFEPTVLDLPDNSNPAAQEEIFGPVASIIGYRDIDHAVEMANDSKYGLSGYVFGSDADEAFAVAKRVHSGSVHVNGALSSTYAPFGGIKASGVGYERGIEGMRLFQRLTVFSVTK
ncbi:MAG: aldehyde dehydrogenase family protein [Rhizomicrobium sp.]